MLIYIADLSANVIYRYPNRAFIITALILCIAEQF